MTWLIFLLESPPLRSKWTTATALRCNGSLWLFFFTEDTIQSTGRHPLPSIPSVFSPRSPCFSRSASSPWCTLCFFLFSFLSLLYTHSHTKKRDDHCLENEGNPRSTTRHVCVAQTLIEMCLIALKPVSRWWLPRTIVDEYRPCNISVSHIYKSKVDFVMEELAIHLTDSSGFSPSFNSTHIVFFFVDEINGIGDEYTAVSPTCDETACHQVSDFWCLWFVRVGDSSSLRLCYHRGGFFLTAELFWEVTWRRKRATVRRFRATEWWARPRWWPGTDSRLTCGVAGHRRGLGRTRRSTGRGVRGTTGRGRNWRRRRLVRRRGATVASIATPGTRGAADDGSWTTWSCRWWDWDTSARTAAGTGLYAAGTTWRRK